MRERFHTALPWVLALVVFFSLLTVRAVWSGRAELALGERLQARGDLEGALVHLRRAARWYVPLAAHPARALDRLRAMAEAAERRGDREFALACWRAQRGAILATRSFFVPFAGRLANVEERIARLMAQAPPPPIDANRSETERYELYLSMLRQRPGPAGWAVALAMAGLLTWLGAAWKVASEGFDEEDRLQPAVVRRWALLFVVGFVMFLTGLRLA